jgi:hypothetical protein
MISKKAIFLPALVFGFDPILEFLRYTKLDGKTYLGFVTDPFHFTGVSFGKGLSAVNQDFPLQVAAALLKFDFQKIWGNTFFWLILYPVIHLILAIILLFIFRKLPKKLEKTFYLILAVLWIIFILSLFNLDPFLVKPVTESGLLGLLQ